MTKDKKIKCKHLIMDFNNLSDERQKARPAIHNPICKLQKNNKIMKIKIATKAKEILKVKHIPPNGECYFYQKDKLKDCPYFEILE